MSYSGIHIVPIKLEDLRSGEVEFGVRVYDDCDNGIELLYEGNAKTLNDDFTCLRIALTAEDGRIRALLDIARERRLGITIGKVDYDWEQVQSVFDELQ